MWNGEGNVKNMAQEIICNIMKRNERKQIYENLWKRSGREMKEISKKLKRRNNEIQKKYLTKW